MIVREGTFWEGEVPGLGLEGQKNGAEAEDRWCGAKGSLGDQVLGEPPRDESTEICSGDVLGKPLERVPGDHRRKRGKPLLCWCSPPPPLPLSPHIFPEHWVPC